MNPVVVHIVSGHAFFTGVALVVVAAIIPTRARPIAKRMAVLASLVGLLAIVISSTPIPYWYCAIAAVGTIVWIASLVRKRLWSRAPTVLAGVWLGAALLELPYHFTPRLQVAADRSVTVFGDSVTAGIGDDETSETWPRILARMHQLEVHDLSHAGETAASALERARAHQIESSVVVLEIGGNDLLGSTSATVFARDLDALLRQVESPTRQIVMLELPLPPFYHAYGRVQRRLAAKHHVALVPKHVFLSVLAARGSTLDSIHLSQAGHQLMADRVWRILEPAFEPKGSG